MEADEPPLAVYWMKLALQYCLKLKSNPPIPLFTCLSFKVLVWIWRQFRKRTCRHSFEVTFLRILVWYIPCFSSWPLDLSQHTKDTALPGFYKRKYLEKIQVWRPWSPFLLMDLKMMRELAHQYGDLVLLTCRWGSCILCWVKGSATSSWTCL